MPVSDERWRAGRIAAFLALAFVLYTALFLWAGGLLRDHGDRNPFFRIEEAERRTDWVVLGASHALPLGFAGVPEAVREATGKDTLTLAVAGGGPAVMRLVAERYLADHKTDSVLIVLDTFSFGDERWNEGRVDDTDFLPKIPADRRTLAVLWNAVSRGLPPETFLAYATGFARITDRTRFRIDRWESEDRFDTAPRPSEAADAARIAYLYPGPASQIAVERGLADLEALIVLAQDHGADVTLVLPPLPDRFRSRMLDMPAVEAGLKTIAERLGVPLLDHAGLVPEARAYFDSDHLNRTGVGLWLERGLADVLAGPVTR